MHPQPDEELSELCVLIELVLFGNTMHILELVVLKSSSIRGCGR